MKGTGRAEFIIYNLLGAYTTSVFSNVLMVNGSAFNAQGKCRHLSLTKVNVSRCSVGAEHFRCWRKVPSVASVLEKNAPQLTDFKAALEDYFLYALLFHP